MRVYCNLSYFYFLCLKGLNENITWWSLAADIISFMFYGKYQYRKRRLGRENAWPSRLICIKELNWVTWRPFLLINSGQSDLFATLSYLCVFSFTLLFHTSSKRNWSAWLIYPGQIANHIIFARIFYFVFIWNVYLRTLMNGKKAFFVCGGLFVVPICCLARID